MDLKQKLIDLAREATGDDDIVVAGDFQPKGMTWKVAAGAVAGSVLGDAVGATDHFGEFVPRPERAQAPQGGHGGPQREVTLGVDGGHLRGAVQVLGGAVETAGVVEGLPEASVMVSACGLDVNGATPIQDLQR